MLTALLEIRKRSREGSALRRPRPAAPAPRAPRDEG